MQIVSAILEAFKHPLAKALLQGQWISVLIAGTGIYVLSTLINTLSFN